MDLFSLVARLTLDRSGYQGGVAEAEGEAQTLADKLKGGLATAAKVGATAIAAVGTAAAAATTALVQQAGQVAAYGDNIDKASQKLGISAEAYQEWDAVLQHSGTSIDSMGIGMKTLASQAAKGSDAFTELGISQEKAASMSREDLFAQTITALQNVTDENKRAQLAQELFGRSAMELGPLLNTSAADTQAMRDRVHELGGVMSNEAVKAAAAYQDNLQDMNTAIDGVKRNIVSEFIPGLSSLMAAFTDILAGDDPGEALEQGIDSIVGAMDNTVKRVVDIGQRVVPALVDAIVKAAPGLLDGAAQLVLTLGEAIIANLPELVRAGLQVIVTLANAIADSLPELVPTIVEVVMEIVEVLTEPSTLSALIDAALAIILALAQGLINALPRLLEKAPVIIAQLVTSIIALAPQLLQAALQLMATFAQGIVRGIASVVTAIGQMGQALFDGVGDIINRAWQWGADLINNFTEGLKAFISKPIDAIKGLAGKIKSFLGFSEPEEGPLSNFHTYAPDMMQLFAKGITENRGVITKAIGEAFDISGLIRDNTDKAAAQTTTAQPGALQQFAAGIIDMPQRISDVITKAIKGAFDISGLIRDNTDKAAAQTTTAQPGVMQQFAAGIIDMPQRISDVITRAIKGAFDISGLIRDNTDKAADQMTTAQPGALQQFAAGIIDMPQRISDVITNMLTGAKQMMIGAIPAPAADNQTTTPIIPSIMQQYMAGIADIRRAITDAAIVADIPQNADLSRAQPQTFTTPIPGGAPRNIVVKLMLDGRELAQTAFPYMTAEEQRVGLSLVTR